MMILSLLTQLIVCAANVRAELRYLDRITPEEIRRIAEMPFLRAGTQERWFLLREDMLSEDFAKLPVEKAAAAIEVYGRLIARGLVAGTRMDEGQTSPEDKNLAILADRYDQVTTDGAYPNHRMPISGIRLLTVVGEHDARPEIQMAISHAWASIAEALGRIGVAEWASDFTVRRAIALLEYIMPRPPAFEALHAIMQTSAKEEIPLVALSAITRGIARVDHDAVANACVEIFLDMNRTSNIKGPINRVN